jgi:tripartite-type tricarboxylate transporter receptor subunit TctC
MKGKREKFRSLVKRARAQLSSGHASESIGRRGGRAAMFTLLGALSGWHPALAENFPTREVKLVVPFPTGGITDLTARVIAKHLTKVWGQPVSVVNMPGGGGTTGTMHVLSAPKDGYTMMLSATGQGTQNPAIDSTLPYKWDEPTLVARTSKHAASCARFFGIASLSG